MFQERRIQAQDSRTLSLNVVFTCWKRLEHVAPRPLQQTGHQWWLRQSEKRPRPPRGCCPNQWANRRWRRKKQRADPGPQHQPEADGHASVPSKTTASWWPPAPSHQRGPTPRWPSSRGQGWTRGRGRSQTTPGNFFPNNTSSSRRRQQDFWRRTSLHRNKWVNIMALRYDHVPKD